MANGGKSKIGSRLVVNQRACAAVIKMIFYRFSIFLQSLVLSKAGTVGTSINYPSKKGVHVHLSTRYWIQRLSNQALIDQESKKRAERTTGTNSSDLA